MKLSVIMTRRESLFGWIYLPICLLFLPGLLGTVNVLLPRPLSETLINILYFSLNFLVVAISFRRFLLSSLRQAWKTRWRCLRCAALGFLLYYAAVLLLGLGISRFFPDFSNVNDSAISALAEEHRTALTFCTVFFVPITEEALYRGLFFQGSRLRRLPAYCLSVLLFAFIHVFGYIGLYNPGTLLLCFAQYLPAGLALAWAYEQSGTIVAPMLMHITINQIGMTAMR